MTDYISPGKDVEENLSELPLLQRTHLKSGYRDGISQGRQDAVQPGFDEAYPTGAGIGLRIGRIIGILEALLENSQDKIESRTMMLEAKLELDLQRLLSSDSDEGQVLNHEENLAIVAEGYMRAQLAYIERAIQKWEDIADETLRAATIPIPMKGSLEPVHG